MTREGNISLTFLLTTILQQESFLQQLLLLLSLSLGQNLYCLMDKSGVDKIIVKKQSYQLVNTNREFFQVLMPPTFINCLMNLRKLGQISSPFCNLHECLKA